MKQSNRIKIEVTHAMEEASGLLIAMTALGNVYVLGREEKSQGQNSRIATKLGPEWFNAEEERFQEYKESIINNSNKTIVEKINDSKVYQDQLWAIIDEEINFESLEKEIKTQNPKKARKDTIDLGFEVEELNIS
jgi:tRNA nucleotidyltransferase (CCA-adding enzyme)